MTTVSTRRTPPSCASRRASVTNGWKLRLPQTSGVPMLAAVQLGPQRGQQRPVLVVDGAAPAERVVVLGHRRQPLVRDPPPGGHGPQERHHVVRLLRATEGQQQDRVVRRERVGFGLRQGHAHRGSPVRRGLGALRSSTTAIIRTTKTMSTAPQTTEAVRCPKCCGHDDDGGAEQGRHGVELAAQHLRHLTGEDVAQDAAADRGDPADQDGGHRAGTDPERLERAGDGEDGQAGGIQDADEAGDALHAGVEHEGDHAGDAGRGDQPPVAEADRGHDADEHVAEHPTAQRGRAGQDEDAEQVEPLLHRDQAAGQREDEHPDEVEDQLQLGVLDEHGGGQNYLCGVACFALAGGDGTVWAVGRPGRWPCKTCD